MDSKKISSLAKAPQVPAVYWFKDQKGTILYVGKAANLRKRLFSYFKTNLDYKTQSLVEKIEAIHYLKLSSPFQALLLEAELIKIHQPKFNIRLKDDKHYPFIEITKEKYPRLHMVRRKKKNAFYLGPFTNKKTVQSVLRLARRVFPYRSCRVMPKKPCLYYHLELCPAPCINPVPEYQETVKNLIAFLKGKNRTLLGNLELKMQEASKRLEFEKADIFKKKIEEVQLVNKLLVAQFDFLSDSQPLFLEQVPSFKRIECFDMSFFSKKDAVGSMVVFEKGKPAKNQYRRFKIRGGGKEDLAMMKEVIRRRLKHKEWPLPQLLIVDGGRGQVKVGHQVLREKGVNIPLLGLIKGSETLIRVKQTSQKTVFEKYQLAGNSPVLKVIQRLRDESHRFALNYHRLLRAKKILP